MLDWLIQYFLIYNIPVLGVTIILQSNAIPTGSNFLVIAAGALAYAGDFSLLYLLLWVWLFNVIGDSLGYWIFKGYGRYILEKFRLSRRLLNYSLRKSARYMEKYGQASIIITRFPLSGLGAPMNFLTGLTGYGYGRFLLAIVPGELLWTMFNLGLGYWFGDAWESIGNTVNQYMQWIISVGALALVLYLLILQLRNHYFHVKTRRKSGPIADETPPALEDSGPPSP
jgi:membrane-associated protein